MTNSSAVTLEFSDAGLNGTKTLGPDLQIASDNNSAAFTLFLGQAANERIFLRHDDIIDIVEKSKGQKREWIAKIIGYEAITDFRGAIQSSRNALQKAPAYGAAKQLSDNAQNELFKLVGGIVASEQDLFAKANELINPYALDGTISDRSTYQKALTALGEKVRQPEQAKTKVRLDQLQKDCHAVVDKVEILLKVEAAFIGPYNDLAKDKGTVSQLNIGQFLISGKAVIEARHFTDPQCPFCLSPYDHEKLREEVEARIQKLTEIRNKYDDAGALKSAFIQAAETLIAVCRPLAANYGELEKFETLTGGAVKILATLNAWVKTTNESFPRFEPVVLSDQERNDIDKFAALAKAEAALAGKESEALELSEHEKKLIETIGKVRDLEKQFDQYQTNARTVQAFEKQILSLSAIFGKFVHVQRAALQLVLDRISEDVGSYYSTLHPKENVDKVRLSMVGEEGVEFEYHFHGTVTHPPKKWIERVASEQPRHLPLSRVRQALQYRNPVPRPGRHCHELRSGAPAAPPSPHQGAAQRLADTSSHA